MVTLDRSGKTNFVDPDGSHRSSASNSLESSKSNETWPHWE